MGLHSSRAMGGAGGRVNASRSSSIDSDSSALGLFGGGGGACAFQIPGYRTVELMPTAQQRQTLQKVRRRCMYRAAVHVELSGVFVFFFHEI